MDQPLVSLLKLPNILYWVKCAILLKVCLFKTSFHSLEKTIDHLGLDPKRTIYARTIRNWFLFLTVVGLALGVVFFIVLYATGYYWLYAIQIMISVYIACIPEILPAIIHVNHCSLTVHKD